MSVHLSNEIRELKKELLSLCSLVEHSVKQAVSAVVHNDCDKAQVVIDNDHEVDLKEVEIEEECLKLLALYQPVAYDLRFLVAALKINNDLERIGDLAVNIARRCKPLSQVKGDNPFDFTLMADKTIRMLKQAIDALILEDTKKAHQVCLQDKEVNELNRDMHHLAYREIRKRPDETKSLLSGLSVSKHLERIADYATNISEDIIYMINGTIVRHMPEDQQLVQEDDFEPDE